MFLTIPDLIQLTGERRRKAQIAWLKAKGYKFELNRKGDILVHKDHVGNRFKAGNPPTPEPDFGAFA